MFRFAGLLLVRYSRSDQGGGGVFAGSNVGGWGVICGGGDQKEATAEESLNARRCSARARSPGIS